MGVAALMMTLQLTIKFNGIVIIPSTIQFRDGQISDEDNEIPDDIIAEIDRESSNESSGRSPMHGSLDPDDMIDHEEDIDNDPPEWEFSPDEAISQNLEYLFCPQPHCQQILCLFTRHFCQHSFFPTQSGVYQTRAKIREQCVQEMYYFCKKRGLSEVWAYMWASWYTPQMWKLWACSTNNRILSRL